MCEFVKIYKKTFCQENQNYVFWRMEEKMEVTYRNFLQSFLKKSSIAVCNASDMLDSIDF